MLQREQLNLCIHFYLVYLVGVGGPQVWFMMPLRHSITEYCVSGILVMETCTELHLISLTLSCITFIQLFIRRQYSEVLWVCILQIHSTYSILQAQKQHYNSNNTDLMAGTITTNFMETRAADDPALTQVG